jgi:signal transduction histidine kinase
MRLIEKIILLMLAISLLPLLVIGSLFYFSVKTTVEKQTTEKLSSVATIQEHRLVDIRSQNLKRLSDFTSRKQLRTLMSTYDRTHDKNTAAAVMGILNDAQSLGKDIHSIVVTDTNGIVVASTEKDPAISTTLASELFNLGKNEDSISLTSRHNGQDSVFLLSGPLIVDGQKIGVAGIEADAAEVLKTVTDNTGLGKTGEIYLGHRSENGQLAYITPHMGENRISNQAITDSALPMYRTLMGEEDVFPNIRDYRGQEVFAVTRSIEDSGWGLVAKIDRSEALLPLTSLRSELILLAFINSVLIVFAAIAIARRLTQPIIDIDEVAEQTSKGNLKSRVAHPSNDEIGNLAGTFNAMLDNLEVFDKAKTDFVSLASHQLRTPLTSIKWAAETLLDPKVRIKKDKQKHYLQQIHDSNERMIKLVGALLHVSKIDVGTLPFKKKSVQLTDSLRQVLDDIDVLIQTKDIKINQKTDENLPPVDIDPTWIHAIFQNLVSNAVRYSRPGESVEVTIEQELDHILITVSDTGYGIPAKQKDKIFTKFFRADNAQLLGSDGSGLGLYITKAMVERTGGSIWFESEENKGSTFYVKLPIKV